ncbi:hypothetical protein B0T17DRAFT_516587 [Bombardia bombarda]|uniref:Uncharacterized protein n=1 Tax=Bombardia bombarda TaxID=252184 RepID=A0AA39XKF1_9PEZI|nr:hypothetical protein B0T17DRAFT_516587 [Bombardia bombarda]
MHMCRPSTTVTASWTWLVSKWWDINMFLTLPVFCQFVSPADQDMGTLNVSVPSRQQAGSRSKILDCVLTPVIFTEEKHAYRNNSPASCKTAKSQCSPSRFLLGCSQTPRA